MQSKRTVRKPMIFGVHVTPRDRLILRSLSEMKFLRTSQIARIGFGRLTSTVGLRLRRLLDAGFVKVWLTALNEENLYSLGSRGLALLADEDSGEESTVHVPRRLERRLDHLLGINDFRIHLQGAITPYEGAITAWQSEWQLKRPGRQELIPDAIFRLRIRKKELSLAFEFDCGGEPAEQVFAAKVRRYVALPPVGGFSLDALLVVVPTTRRLLALLEAAARERGAGNFLFTLREKTLPDNILTKIWTSPRLALTKNDPSFISLLDLFSGAAR